MMMYDVHDPYTAGHGHRTGILAREIALKLGYSEDHAENLELIGMVHDVGKITVPANILSKPTKLEPIEFTLLKAHCHVGYEIFKDFEFPLPIADIILQHHERLDGTGYPQGLTEHQILPESKILAVADVFEAMASRRPYREALGFDEALAELVRYSGTKYCSDSVKALSTLIKDEGYRLEE